MLLLSLSMRCVMRIIELGKKGATYVQMVTACGVSRQTGENWKERFPEWDEAVKIALTHSAAYYDEMGQRNIEWQNAKGEPQFRENTWRDIKTDVKTANQSKEEKQTKEVTEVMTKVTDMVKTIRGEDI